MTKAERTRQHVIEKAAPLFNKKGYAGTSLSDIMKVTGLAKGGVYGNFKSKDEIAALAFEYSYSKIKAEIKVRLLHCRSATEKLFAILDFYRNYTVKSPVDGGCPLINTSVDADDSFPFLKRKVKLAQNEMLESLVHLFTKAVENKELSKNCDARREAEMMYALIDGGILMAKINDDPKILNRIVDRIKEHIHTNLAR